MTKVTQNLNFEGSTIYVGMDVHLKSWNISVYCNETYIKSFNQPPSPEVLRDYLIKNYPNAKYKCAYEAGFCGFWIQRQLSEYAIDCILVNASDVPQTDKSNRTKTDKNDSIRIAKGLQAGLLVANHVPDKELEADRSLVRCYEKYNKDLRRAKSRIKGLLYQVGIELPAQFQSNNWSGKFIQWLKELKFENTSLKSTLNYNIVMAEYIRTQKLQVLKDIRLLLLKERYAIIAKFLMSIPGIGQLTAATLLVEIGDIKRFDNFEKLNSFIGFYPSQFSSGESIRMGSITTRKHHRLRSLLLEAAWMSIRNDPAMLMAFNDFKNKVGGKRAIIKIARKLLSRLRYVWTNQKEYEKGVVH